ncbi:sigma-70 family RNA polymerase sigma factor [Paraburkholderia sp. SARCC-3016]|uniref:sigma-70 family RNA polymerase sigma factor n=1 Tax=Paraburkholderia sp. SARCC-3016 TaxID=3058611 RepID=UPI002808979D|nr:sigma-70 family RNA polymerase sigma factor [Paraburkholderia sp. SARCC-3016]MDQ7981544.1 sigma-70 family RNA polymerase sigma factor [Paraburkholderia sp. SARCC-3016]
MVTSTDASQQNAVEHALRSLLKRSFDGDGAAYRAFLDALALHLHAYLRRRLYPLLDDIDDIVQEIMLAVHDARATYRWNEPLTAWVYAIARYKLADYWRAKSRWIALHQTLDTGYEFQGTSDTERADAKRDIETMLKRLPRKQQMLIVWIKLQGLSVIEAAQLTGWSQAAIKASLHRGMKSLTRRMDASRAPSATSAS